jgi:hypothetical protein
MSEKNEDAVKIDKLRNAMYAAYSALQNDSPCSARECCIVGLMGGSVNNPLDFHRCVKEWNDKYKSKEKR